MSNEKLMPTLTFHLGEATADKEIARFGPDGVWVNPDLSLNEAARQFLDIVNIMWGSHFTRPAVELERRRLEKEVQKMIDKCEEHSRGEECPEWYRQAYFAYYSGCSAGLRQVLATLKDDTSHE